MQKKRIFQDKKSLTEKGGGLNLFFNMDHPTFSIIVPVLHEAERINDLICHLRQLDSEKSSEISSSSSTIRMVFSFSDNRTPTSSG